MSDTTASTRFSPITTSAHSNGEIVLDALDERGDVGRFDGKTPSGRCCPEIDGEMAGARAVLAHRGGPAHPPTGKERRLPGRR